MDSPEGTSKIEQASTNDPSTTRCAVVTGGNKGIGFEICKQLASKGITVVLTSRDEKRGLEAVDKIRSDRDHHILYHQLDVTDPSSIASLALFIKTQFGKLDILVNNAGTSGVTLDYNALSKATEVAGGGWPTGKHVDWSKMAIRSFEKEEECLKTNYYGAKRTTEALLPLLCLSHCANIVNVSSFLGFLQNIESERVKTVFGCDNVEEITIEKVDDLLNQFLRDCKEDKLEANGWPASAYQLSKAAMNAYTRIIAKQYPSICVNAVSPGFVKTDITGGLGMLTAAEGAKFIVRLALLPSGSRSGCFFKKLEQTCY